MASFHKYTIGPMDALRTIATRYLEDSGQINLQAFVDAIRYQNNLSVPNSAGIWDWDKLVPGTVIILPYAK